MNKNIKLQYCKLKCKCLKRKYAVGKIKTLNAYECFPLCTMKSIFFLSHPPHSFPSPHHPHPGRGWWPGPLLLEAQEALTCTGDGRVREKNHCFFFFFPPLFPSWETINAERNVDINNSVTPSTSTLHNKLGALTAATHRKSGRKPG